MSSWIFFALGSAFFAGITAVLSKIGVEGVPSNLATLIRIVVIFPFVVFLVWSMGDWRAPSTIPARTMLFLALSGVATGLSWLCYYHALQLGPASLVSPIDKLSLLVAVILAVTMLGERLNTRQWAGAALMVVSTLLIAWK